MVTRRRLPIFPSPYVCSICKDWFLSQNDFIEHFKTNWYCFHNINLRQYGCKAEKCGKVFTTLKDVLLHMLRECEVNKKLNIYNIIFI